MDELKVAESIVNVLGDSRWMGVQLAKAYLGLASGTPKEKIAKDIYRSGCITLARAMEIIPIIEKSGFICYIPHRKKLGSAENPITKLFPAAITEQRFLAEIDSLRITRKTVDYTDFRYLFIKLTTLSKRNLT